MSKFAVIDLGSSTVKLTVAEVSGSMISVIYDDRSSSFPLGEDIVQIGRLKKDTIMSNAEVIKSWQKKLEDYGVSATRLVSTGAARKAPNKDELADILKSATGLDLEIIQAEDEARILFEAIVCDLSNNNQPVVALNVGGSSTELILGKTTGVDAFYSFDKLGVRGLRQFLKSDPPTELEHSILVERINQEFAEQSFSSSENSLFFHTGGELDYMISAQYPLEDRLFLSHPKKISVSRFVAHSDMLRRKIRAELHKLSPDPNNPEWMDGAVVCNALAVCVAITLEISEIIPSNRNLIDGLLLQLQDKVYN